MVKSDIAFNEKNEILDSIEKNKEEAKARFNKHFAVENSQLAPVFDLYRNKGLNAALDKYYELLFKDPTLASKDDKGLIDDGNKVYSIRYTDNPNDPEARYYYGTLQYINGLYEEAEIALKPFRKNPGQFASRIQPFLDGLDTWKEQEKIRLAALRYEEEQRLAREAKEAKEKEKEEANKNDVWAKIKNKSKENGSNKNGDLAKEDKTQASASHDEGYKLYKKGKLDEAIAKYEEAIAKDRDNPEYNYHLGLAWMDKGFAGDTSAYDKAVEYYQNAINAAPNSKFAEEAKSMIDGIQQTKQSLGEK